MISVDGVATSSETAPAPASADPLALERREAVVRLRAFLATAHLTGAEKRRLRATLAHAGETRAAALAYFASVDADGRPSSTQAHLDEIDEVVEGDLGARLGELLGPVRGPLAERRLQPLAPLAALDPAALPR